LRQGQPGAVEKALRTVSDEKADPKKRLQFIEVFGETKHSACVPVLLQILDRSKDQALRKATLGALLLYDDTSIGHKVVSLYNSLDTETLPVAQNLLASRATWSRLLVKAVQTGGIKSEAVPLNIVRKIKLHPDDSLGRLAENIWGATESPASAEMDQQINRLKTVLGSGIGNPYNGRPLYEKACGACHVLFLQGGQVGPDLTTFKRDDLENMLLSIVNPSAEIREGYENFLVDTKDDRSLNGFLVEQDNHVIVLRCVDGQTVTLDRKEIVEMRPAGMSLMPEGLLEPLQEQEVRDLFAYLRSTQPLVGKTP